MADPLHDKFAPYLDSLQQATHCQVIERLWGCIEPPYGGMYIVVKWEEERVSVAATGKRGETVQTVLDYLAGLGWRETGVKQDQYQEERIFYDEVIYTLETVSEMG